MPTDLVAYNTNIKFIITALNSCAQGMGSSVELSAEECKALVDRIEEVSEKKITEFIYEGE